MLPLGPRQPPSCQQMIQPPPVFARHGRTPRQGGRDGFRRVFEWGEYSAISTLALRILTTQWDEINTVQETLEGAPKLNGSLRRHY